MAATAVVTDSTADFAGIDPEKLNITVVPLTVNWGGDVLRDRVDISTSEFYLRLRTDPTLPKTAAPPVGIFEEVYRSLLATHDAVISVHISAQLSGTLGVASSAARSVDRERVHLVDSGGLSVGLGWLAARAAERGAAGEDPATILATLEHMIPRLRFLGALETLEYLQKGGRIGRAQAFLGGLLNVKPILQLRDGEVHPIERVRTRQASIRRLASLTHELGPKESLAVVHGDCRAEAQALSDELAQVEGLAVSIVEIGCVFGVHAGPGLLGAVSLLAG